MASDQELTDCHFYLLGSCNKGGECPYRHCAAAKRNRIECEKWGSPEGCSDRGCAFRHPSRAASKEKDRSLIPCYWESQPSGCLKGAMCPFLHSKRAPASEGASASKPAATDAKLAPAKRPADDGDKKTEGASAGAPPVQRVVKLNRISSEKGPSFGIKSLNELQRDTSTTSADGAPPPPAPAPAPPAAKKAAEPAKPAAKPAPKAAAKPSPKAKAPAPAAADPSPSSSAPTSTPTPAPAVVAPAAKAPASAKPAADAAPSAPAKRKAPEAPAAPSEAPAAPASAKAPSKAAKPSPKAPKAAAATAAKPPATGAKAAAAPAPAAASPVGDDDELARLERELEEVGVTLSK